MIPLLKSDEAKKLKIKAPWWNNQKDDEGFPESGSKRFAGQTFDILLTGGKIRRVTFGVTVTFVGRVAIMSEILRLPYEEPKPDFIDAILNRSFIENGWD